MQDEQIDCLSQFDKKVIYKNGEQKDVIECAANETICASALTTCWSVQTNHQIDCDSCVNDFCYIKDSVDCGCIDSTNNEIGCEACAGEPCKFELP